MLVSRNGGMAECAATATANATANATATASVASLLRHQQRAREHSCTRAAACVVAPRAALVLAAPPSRGVPSADGDRVCGVWSVRARPRNLEPRTTWRAARPF